MSVTMSDRLTVAHPPVARRWSCMTPVISMVLVVQDVVDQVLPVIVVPVVDMVAAGLRRRTFLSVGLRKERHGLEFRMIKLRIDQFEIVLRDGQ